MLESIASFPLALVLGLGALLAVVVGRALARVGVGFPEAALLLVGAPLLSTWEPPVSLLERGGSVVLVNGGGFVIPLAVAAVAFLFRRAPFAATLAATAFVSLVSYATSVAVPEQGILLYYRLPALAAGIAAVVVTRRRYAEAGAVAFVAGSLGVILGADFARLPELLAAEGARRIVLGGAGILDGIFLVGLLGIVVVIVVQGIDTTWRVLRARHAAKPAAEADFGVA